MVFEIWLLLLCSAISPSLSLRCVKPWISTLWKLLTMFYVFVFVYFKKSICTTFVNENSSSWPHLSHSDSFPLEVTTYKLFIFRLMLLNYQKILTFDWLRPVKMGLFWESMLNFFIFKNPNLDVYCLHTMEDENISCNLYQYFFSLKFLNVIVLFD